MYLDKTTLNRNSYTNVSTVAAVSTLSAYPTLAGLASMPAFGTINFAGFSALSTCTTTAYSGNSTAFYYQRLRVGTDFIVSPGLKLVTRFDAMERIWGAARSGASAGGDSFTASDISSNGSRAESENIAFDVAYIDYVSPIGLFRVGYMPSGTWGSSFGDSEFNGTPDPRLVYAIPIGPVAIGASMTKSGERSKSYIYTTNYQTDRDYEKYAAFVNWDKNKDYQAGLAFEYRRIALNKTAPDAASPLVPLYSAFAQSYALNPYARAKFGPVTINAEATYAWGQVDWEDNNATTFSVNTIKIENVSAYLDVMADFKMVYGGLTFAYVSGDDPGTTDKLEGGLAKGGRDFNPTLIMFNYERGYWAGPLAGYGATGNTSPWINIANQVVGGTSSALTAENEMINVWLFQGKVGVRPVAGLDINASLTYANAATKPASINTTTYAAGPSVMNNALGWELDLTGTYKLTNNLSYMLGAGYLWTGDYFQGDTIQGVSNDNDVNNNYILVNKLTLTF